jgi:hypothetical protein
MKFLSYDNEKGEEYTTEVRNADSKTTNIFVQTWVSSHLLRTLKEVDYSYALFEWDKILKISFIPGSPFRCYGSYTGARLEGLLCLSVDGKVKVEFLATAPWNYGKRGKMRRIGSGLVYFVIKNSIYLGQDGCFYLDALPDAEKFYEGIGMTSTGNMNSAGLREYKMGNKEAYIFIVNFKKYVIEE